MTVGPLDIEDNREPVRLDHPVSSIFCPEYLQERCKIRLIPDRDGHLSLLDIDIANIPDPDHARYLFRDSCGNKEGNSWIDRDMEFFNDTEQVMVEEYHIGDTAIVVPACLFGALHFEILDRIHLGSLDKP